MKTQTVIRSLAIAGIMLLMAFVFSFTFQKDDSSTDKIITKIADNYPSVVIGNQEWMTENLNVSTFRNGDPIPKAKTDEEWKRAGIEGKPAWCYHENNRENGNIYGKLYNWYAVNDPRGLAPEGWHVPTDEEWTILIEYLGGNWLVGGKMRSTGTQYWSSPNEDATNSSGFSGLPGGNRNDYGSFYTIGSYGFWWSSTENAFYAWYRSLNIELGVIRGYIKQSSGISVRCLRD